MFRPQGHLQALEFVILTLASSLPLGHTDIAVEGTETRIVKGQIHILNKCYYVGHVYGPFIHNPWNKSATNNYTGCQKLCQALDECRFFTFFADEKQCRLAGTSATFKRAQVTATGPMTALGIPITGPRECPKHVPRGCTEMPRPGFPGADRIQSEMAWPSHRVPQNLECWPKNWTTGTYGHCASVEVLENTANGWPGKCKGLHMVLTPHLESCESYCRKKITCAVFQEVQIPRPFGPKTCWHGDRTAGLDCYERKSEGSTDFAPLSAKRFKRGTVRVLAELRGVELKGLVNTFPETYFLDVRDAAKACRYHCYSNIFCQYWQYFLESGCWTEDPVLGAPMPHPPTTQVWTTGTFTASTAIDGEYVQHLCFQEGEGKPIVQHKWQIVANHSSCDSKLLVDLGAGRGEVDHCKHLTIADGECSNEMLADGWNCWCVARDKVCNRGRGNATLFRHSMEKRESKFEHLKEKHPDVLREHGFKPMPTLKPTRLTKLFQVTLTLSGLKAEAIGETQMVVLTNSFSNAVAGALRVPTSSVQDLRRNRGSLNIYNTAAANRSKVSFTVVTPTSVHSANIRDGLSNKSFVAQLQGSAHNFTPEAIVGGINLLSVLVDRRGTNLPNFAPPEHVLDNEPEAHLNWSPLWLLALPAGAVVAGILYLATGDPLSQEAEGDSSDEKEMQERRLSRRAGSDDTDRRRSRVQARESIGGNAQIPPRYAPLQ